MNLPNILTFIRIFAIPVFVAVFYLPAPWAHLASAAIFAVAGFTDWLDGYLARNLGLGTPFGAFLDPVADKLMVAVALVLVVGEQNIPFIAVPASIIVGREIVISALREWMSELGKRTSVIVGQIGKLKTSMQMLALLLLLLYTPGTSFWLSGMSFWLMFLGTVLLYVAAVLTLWSMVVYLKIAWPDLTLSLKSNKKQGLEL